jgi:hypothetical protein
MRASNDSANLMFPFSWNCEGLSGTGAKWRSKNSHCGSGKAPGSDENDLSGTADLLVNIRSAIELCSSLKDSSFQRLVVLW